MGEVEEQEVDLSQKRGRFLLLGNNLDHKV